MSSDVDEHMVAKEGKALRFLAVLRLLMFPHMFSIININPQISIPSPLLSLLNTSILQLIILN